MNTGNRAFKNIVFHMAVILFFVVATVFFLPVVSHAKDSVKDTNQKVVRVGWFDSSFCYFDQFGRRCGIDFEYQQKISAYTGWTYEYVEGSWPNLFQMLEEGKIDLLCDVSYKPERAKTMLFPDLPMGAESYYIYIDAKNRKINSDNLESFNGTRIGVNEGSIQEGFLRDWARKNKLSVEVVPLDVDEDESMEMVVQGKIDGYASIYSFSSEQKVVPISRVGSSEYYYAVNKRRPDLLTELNIALGSIQDEDPTFNQRLNEERLFNSRTNAFLTPIQEDWVKDHGAIRVGYCDNLLPFCQSDPETGELTGALKDYLAHASNNLRSTDIRFEATPFDSTRKALDALKSGKIDCVFPLYLSSYDADKMGIRLTNPLMTTEMNAVMRRTENQSLSRDSKIAFAITSDEINVDTFIKDRYPESTIKPFQSLEDCFSAVSSGAADCTLCSNYRIPLVEERINSQQLLSIPTGEVMPLSFAVNRDARELYFLLNKTVVMTRTEDMDAALASYMHTGQKVSLTEFLRDNWLGVIAVLMILFFVIIVLLLQKLKAERKAYEHQKMMEEGLRRELEQKEQLQSAMEMAYRDPLTGVKSKHAYNDAEKVMDQRISEGDALEFSVVVFDLNDLKRINDSEGHDTGDAYIKDACNMICSCFKHSPVFRIGGDEFVAILEGEDYAFRNDLLELFEKQVLANLDHNRSVVAFGCATFDPHKDKAMNSVFERADASMYKEKVLLKSLGSEYREKSEGAEDQISTPNSFNEFSIRKHILIADDIESNRDILGDLLMDDYDIIFASDGLEAMEILRSHKDEIALVLLDLYMPKMSGRDVMKQMQVDEELMFIPVIFITIDPDAELDCLKIGAMDFIPKPYPDIEIIKARISKCIELAENRDLIRRTQRDKLTGLYNIDYFLRYVNRYDQHYEGMAFDAVVCDINEFYSVNDQYGRQFGDLALRSIGIGISKLARKIGGIGCRKEGDTFLLYCPHQEGYEQLLSKLLEDLFLEEDTSNKVKLRFGVFANAHLIPDIEARFDRAKEAADSAEFDPDLIIGYVDD